MDLQQILQWLQRQLRTQQEWDAARQREAEALGRNTFRDPNGMIMQQGLGGIYSDSLPFTPTDQFRYKHPGLAEILNRPPEPTPMFQKQPYKGWL